jgi:hypothetical protein
MSFIATSKFGDCSQCTATNTNVVKRGKDLFCLNCARANKVKGQVERANVRNKVRRLVQTTGNLEMAKEQVAMNGISSLIQDLDAVISRYVRIAASDKFGMATCYTCDAVFPYQKMDCSHFINREHLATRFLLQNLRCCCVKCNRLENGNLKVFADRLEAENEGIVDWLAEQARNVCKPSQDELKQLLIQFRSKLKLVESKLVKT